MATLRAGLRLSGNFVRNLAWAQGWDRKGEMPTSMKDRAWWAAIMTQDAMMISTKEWERSAMELLGEIGHLSPAATCWLKAERKRMARVQALAEDGLAQARAKVAALREASKARRLEVESLRADLSSVETLLSQRSQSEDPVGWFQFNQRKAELESQLSMIQMDTRLAVEIHEKHMGPLLREKWH